MKILKIFLFWRLGLLAVTYLGSLTFRQVEGPFDFWASWAQWDGGHFWQIANWGYRAPEDFAFFPLYPIVIKITSVLTGLSILTAGLLVSNLAFLIFLYLLFRLVAAKFNQKIAASTLITFLFFPTTFFAVAFYSESLFLTLTALTFLALAQKKYLRASAAISLASLTRGIGVFLIFAAVFSYLSRADFNIKKINSKILRLVPALFGIAIYLIYLAATTGDPLKFLTVQSFWQRSVTDPISTIISYFWPVITVSSRPFNDYLDLGLTILFIAVLILGIRKIPSSLWIFSMLAILIPTATSTLTSMPRYLLSSLGAFIIIGQFLEEKPKLKIPVWVVSILLQIFFAVRFINGYWVA